MVSPYAQSVLRNCRFCQEGGSRGVKPLEPETIHSRVEVAARNRRTRSATVTVASALASASPAHCEQARRLRSLFQSCCVQDAEPKAVALLQSAKRLCFFQTCKVWNHLLSAPPAQIWNSSTRSQQRGFSLQLELGW